MAIEDEGREADGGARWEVLFGIVLAIFAAVLAVCDLGAGKFGDDELMAVNEKAAAYMWYQSKSIKESLSEGQAELLGALLDAGSVAGGSRAGVEAQREHLRDEAARYDREKTEILLGSAKVGKEKWAQEVDGELGKIVGATEWQQKATALGAAGDVFDLATLFLQMALVLGAIGLVVHQKTMKIAFFGFLVVLGLLGTWYTWVAWGMASKI